MIRKRWASPRTGTDGLKAILGGDNRSRSLAGSLRRRGLDTTEADPDAQVVSDLRMSRRQMLYFGQKALELVVERFESLSGEISWEDEFQQCLEDQLSEDPPEDGRLAAEVIERAARRSTAHGA